MGSFARKGHALSSYLDILIISDKIPEKLDLEFYCKLVKNLSVDERVNIHPVNRTKFRDGGYTLQDCLYDLQTILYLEQAEIFLQSQTTPEV